MVDIPCIEVLWGPASAAIRANPRDTAFVKESLDEIRKQDGCIDIYWGLQIEDPSINYSCITWISPKHRQTASNLKDTLGAGLPLFDTDAEKPVSRLLVGLTTSPHKALGAPVLEVATIERREGQTMADLEAFMDELVAACDALPREKGAYGASWGRVIDIDLKVQEKQKREAAVIVLFVGWATRDAHYDNVSSDPTLAGLLPRSRILSDYAVAHIPLAHYSQE